MKKKSPKVSRHSACPIWAKAGKIPNPIDYERGMLALPPIIPEHLLLFSRSSRQKILAETAKVKHHRFVFIVILKGSGDVCVDERIFHCKSGNILLLFPFQFHHFLSFPQSEIRWLFCTFELKEPSVLDPLRNQIHTLTRKLFNMIQDVVEDMPTSSSEATEQATMTQLRLALVLHQLLRDNAKQNSISPSTVGGEGTILLDKINKYINKNISRGFSLKEVAQYIGYSESHLRSIFRHQIKMSLGHYINEVRLRKATGLLHQGDLNISTVGEMSGYASLYSFSRAFRNALGCSPSEYKEKYR